MVAVLGPNGAGKTTAISLLIGMIPFVALGLFIATSPG